MKKGLMNETAMQKFLVLLPSSSIQKALCVCATNTIHPCNNLSLIPNRFRITTMLSVLHSCVYGIEGTTELENNHIS